MKIHTSKLTFFGTGTSQGIPVIGSTHPVCLSNNHKDKRLRSSVYLEIDERQILIDCGPDFRQQMLICDKNKLDAILFTHEHNDHIIGLDDVRPIFFSQKKDIRLFGSERVLNDIKYRFQYAFKDEKYPGVPNFELNVIDEGVFKVDDIEIEALPIMHGNLPIFGFKVFDLVYITDASKIEDEVIENISKCNILIINALRKEPRHYSHFVLKEALEVIAKVQPQKAYITHISHHLGFHEEVQKELPENVFLAYDGLEVEF